MTCYLTKMMTGNLVSIWNADAKRAAYRVTSRAIALCGVDEWADGKVKISRTDFCFGFIRSLMVRAKCPVCCDYDRPFVIFPCGHGVCVQHFQDLGGRLEPTALVAPTSAQERVEFTDTDGDQIAFLVNALGGLDYQVNGRPKVNSLTRLFLDGCTLHLDGASAGTWQSARRTTVPRSQVAMASQAVVLFQACASARGGSGAHGAHGSDPMETVEYVDTDGDQIAFIINAAGGMDYIVNGRIKVRNLSELRIGGNTIHLNGESAGRWSSRRRPSFSAPFPAKYWFTAWFEGLWGKVLRRCSAADLSERRSPEVSKRPKCRLICSNDRKGEDALAERDKTPLSYAEVMLVFAGAIEARPSTRNWVEVEDFVKRAASLTKEIEEKKKELQELEEAIKTDLSGKCYRATGDGGLSIETSSVKQDVPPGTGPVLQYQDYEQLVLNSNKEGMDFLRRGQFKQAFEQLKYAEAVVPAEKSEDEPTNLMSVTCNNLGCYYKKACAYCF
ncbi:unnamed protein product [Symbiodinium natans]|uniref:Uncharacterized protein n=1 Tax=Symbiodinium natans TaxID=878477 RepID=A0A812K3Y2_9DINO|nr:unnamed protein product [Symbiodinium natans]